jgi:tetratricopeptide (TPR) repeat protein
MKFKSHSLSALCFAISISGCSSINGDFGFANILKDAGSKSQQAEPTRTQVLLKAGVEYLQKAELDKAQAVFNTGLKFDLNNAALHFFNAFAYQLKFEKGEIDAFASAEAGYKTALSLDSTLDVAYLQLGRLYTSNTKFIEAKKAFALAVDAKPKNPQEALMGLTQASMLSGDTKTAIWAVSKLDDLEWKDPRLYRAKALLAAVAKQPALATEMIEQYSELEKNNKETRYLSSRVNQLLAMKTSMQTGDKLDLKPRDIVLAQAKTEEAGEKGKEVVNEKKAQAAPSEERKNWFRCDLRPAPVEEKDVTPLLNTPHLPVTEENAHAITLPAPCPGEIPPSAIIEVTMIRTEEVIQKSFGINLLDGLNLGRSLVQANDGTITKTSQLFNTKGATVNDVVAGQTADPFSTGFLQYSLNIANSLYTKNEVIARPTLAAVDRLPSVFFSGGNYSIAVRGTSGGGSVLVDKQTGVALSITPTFVDEEHVMINVRASRSFKEESSDPTNIPLVLTRNTVNAAALVRFGQTFVLNGLVEREKDQTQNFTPVLGEIPILQYFFKRQVTVDFNRQILTLITVRKLVDSDDSRDKAKLSDGGATLSLHKLSDEVDEFMKVQNNKPVLDEVLSGLKKDNFLFQKLSRRDLIQESYGSKKFLDRIIGDLKDMLYF